MRTGLHKSPSRERGGGGFLGELIPDGNQCRLLPAASRLATGAFNRPRPGGPCSGTSSPGFAGEQGFPTRRPRPTCSRGNTAGFRSTLCVRISLSVPKVRAYCKPLEHLEPPPVSPARGPPTEWGELVQGHLRPRRRPDLARRAPCDRHPFTLNRPPRAAAEPACAEPRKPCFDSGFHGRLRPSFASQDRLKTGSSPIGCAQEPTSRQRHGAELPLTVLSFIL